MKRYTKLQYLLLYVACVGFVAASFALLAALIPTVKDMVSYNYGMTTTIVVTIPAVNFILAYRNRD